MGEGGQDRLGQRDTILEDCATLAQLDYVLDLSSHSLRRGMATSVHRADTDFRVNLKNEVNIETLLRELREFRVELRSKPEE